jgi:hypothetical protein
MPALDVRTLTGSPDFIIPQRFAAFSRRSQSLPQPTRAAMFIRHRRALRECEQLLHDS